MIIKCAYCEKRIGIKGDPSDTRISHGACPECFEKEMKKIKEMPEMQEKKDIGEKPMEPKFPLK